MALAADEQFGAFFNAFADVGLHAVILLLRHHRPNGNLGIGWIADADGAHSFDYGALGRFELLPWHKQSRPGGAGLTHPLRAYRAIVDLAPVVAISRSPNRADRRVAQRRCVPGSSAVTPSKRRPLDLASRRLSPYRSRASPRRKLPSVRELHTITRYRAQSQADQNSFTAIALCVCHEQSETLQKFAPKSKDLQKPVATWRSPCDSATADKVMRNGRPESVTKTDPKR
jgi:hypothetical protein